MKHFIRAKPISEMSFEAARVEVKRTKELVLGHDPIATVKIIRALAARFKRLQIHGFLIDEDIAGALWEAAEASGLIDHLTVGAVQEIIAGGMDDAMAAPDSDPDRPRAVEATPYEWTPPAAIPKREWIYGNLLIRKFVTATVAPGGVGKSSLISAEVLAMVSGHDLLGVKPAEKLRTWLWNLEDPQLETTRKLQAAAIQFKLEPADMGNRLFVDSGRDQKLVIATTSKTGTMIAKPVVDALISELVANEIDVLVVDPFVSCHEVSENDNSAMDMVIKEWGYVADRANCAVHLVHHTRKMGGVESEVTAETSRGGKAMTDGCRVVRAVNRMSKEEAARAGVENHRLYFRTFNDKANLTPPADQSDWFKLESVDLGNGDLPGGFGGDSIGVTVNWKWPDPLDGVTADDFDKASRAIRAGKWRENSQAKDWVGKAVAEALDLNLDRKQEKAKVAALVKSWLSYGSLVIVEGEDDKRMPRKFVEVSEDA